MRNLIRFVFLHKESGTDGLSDTKVTIDAAMAFSSENYSDYFHKALGIFLHLFRENIMKYGGNRIQFLPIGGRQNAEKRKHMSDKSK